MRIFRLNRPVRIAILLATILTLLSIGTVPSLTQTTGAPVPISAPTPLLGPTPPVDDLAQCSQLLDKTFTALQDCRTLAQSRLDEINALKADKVINDQMKVRYEKIIKDADERIAILQKQKCSSISFFFGLIKIKQC